ncbi:MAG: endonuclease MutS2 [Oscillospiraceae bacterium]|jgi:DNA mismatch repair protein MutS2|nr:endonuclease MutS2 [Oscillospiraceae bacterium]
MDEIYKNFIKPLELEKVLKLLAERGGCPDTKKRALELECSGDLETVQTELLRTSDAHRIIARFGAPSVYGLVNADNSLDKAGAGGTLSMGELLNVASVLRTVRAFSEFYSKIRDMETSLDYLFFGLSPFREIEDRINAAIISEEEMSDNASPALSDIRRKIKNASNRVRESLEKIIRSQQQQKFLQEAIITQRNGRYVIPVKTEHRGEIKGLVHDTSSSGATLFVEPAGVVEANNEIRILEAKEREEINRILAALSAEAGEVAGTVKYSYSLIIELDLYFSKARLAYEMNAVVPKVGAEGRVSIKKARHPLIPKDVVVPIDIRLGDGFDSLIITGPNTGGKTVALKTLGLLTLMAEAGLMIPAAEGSSICVFDKVLADIGDEQSIEQSLSTFSAHMVNIIKILSAADENSLVLLDELGAGTDPVEGAALATAILEELRSLGAKIAATTHYAELKAFALETRGVENACCEFDLASLKPTYRLLIGLPGKSNAFAISERLGIRPDVVERARSLVSSEKNRFEDVVSALEERRRGLEEEKEKAAALRAEIEKKRDEMRHSSRVFEEQREKELEKARAEARSIIEKVQAQSNQLIDELNQIRKDKNSENFRDRASKARADINSRLKSLAKEADFVPKDKNAGYVLPRPLAAGDVVLISDIGKKGVVISPADSSGTVLVQAGIIKTRVKENLLRLEEEKKITSEKLPAKSGSPRSETLSPVSHEIDVRGMNSEEALMEIDKFLDNAVFSNIRTLTVIHGKGTGILRKSVHEQLRKHRNVKSYRLGAFGEGDSGVTLVELK